MSYGLNVEMHKQVRKFWIDFFFFLKKLVIDNAIYYKQEFIRSLMYFYWKSACINWCQFKIFT